MKVVFFANSSALYGANKSLIDLLFFLKKRRIQILVISPSKGEFDQFLKKNNINVQVIPFEFNYHENTLKSNIKTPLRFIRRLYKSRKCLDTVKSFQPDLIYSNSSIVNVGILLAKYLKLPHIWHLREDIYTHYSYTFDFGISFQRLLFNLSNSIIANSTYTARKNLGSKEKKAKVIYNGVFYREDIQKYKKHIVNKVKNFAIVGLLHPNKRQLEAIHAFGKLVKYNSSLKLHIVGSGSPQYTNQLKNLVVDLKITNNVIFHGYISHMINLYRSMDFLLVFSKGEAMGRVTVEAMAFGIPVMGYRSGGTVEIVEHGKNGFLFDTDDEMAEYINRINSDNNLYEELSIGAKNSAIQKYTIDLYGESIYSVIEETLASKPLL